MQPESLAMDTFGSGYRQRTNTHASFASSARSLTSPASPQAAAEEPGPIKRATKEWYEIQQELPPQITRRLVIFHVGILYIRCD